MLYFMINLFESLTIGNITVKLSPATLLVINAS